MTPAEQLRERALARAAKVQGDLSLLALHERAIALLDDPDRAGAVRTQALERIALWEARRLCNVRYIEAWRAIMKLSQPAMSAAILRTDSEGVALRQNTPFGFLATHDAV